MNTAITYLTDSVISIVGFLVNFFIGIVVSVYVLFDKDKFRGQAKKIAFCVHEAEKRQYRHRYRAPRT